MNLLVKNAIIIDKNSKLHRKKRDVLITKGKIVKIAASIKNENNYKEIKKSNLHISAGWFDGSVSFGEPGYEDRETIENGLFVAAKSGFTGVAVNPITNPVVDNHIAVRFLVNASNNNITDLYPIGSLTKKAAGEEMAEMYDMKEAGAIAFSDYKRAVKNPNLLKVSMRYAQAFDGLIMSHPQDHHIANDGVANESPNMMHIGLKGNPNLAEELQITRDLHILAYTGGRLHIPTITTKESVKLIKDAQKSGLQVTCSVAAHHLVLTDDLLEDYNSSYKVNPPLRSKKDCKALQKGVKDGVISFITSDHRPIDIEDKKKEFSLAKDGTIGLESFFGAVNSVLELDDLIESITSKPRRVYNLETVEIKEGNVANLTFFNPDIDWIFTRESILSSSHNSAFIGEMMKGEVYGVFNNNKLIIEGL